MRIRGLFVHAVLAAAAMGGIEARAQLANDGEWPMPARDYASTRFSPLDQINTGNDRNLKIDWTISTGLTRGHEAAPQVVNNTMNIKTP